MAEGLNKSAARNIFYGGSLFFFLLFAALTAHSHWYMVNVSTDSEGLTDSVKHGKEVWKRTCASTATASWARALTSPPS